MSRSGCTNRRDGLGWTCASCDQLITSIDDGWVEWLAWEDDHGATILRGLRLIHRWVLSEREREHGCRYDSRKEFNENVCIVEGLALERFTGPDGLMLLLSFVEAGEFPKEDILELAKRVHIPGYELSRELFPEAISRSVCAPFLGNGYYLQSEIQKVLHWAAGERSLSADRSSLSNSGPNNE